MYIHSMGLHGVGVLHVGANSAVVHGMGGGGG
jgi:hypothetical protein